jgi:hypothetical protein
VLNLSPNINGADLAIAIYTFLTGWDSIFFSKRVRMEESQLQDAPNNIYQMKK